MTKYTVSEKVAENRNTVLCISEGKFKDVEFSFGAINFIEAEDESECTLQYDFGVVDSKRVELEENEEFQVVVGDILLDILDHQVDKSENAPDAI